MLSSLLIFFTDGFGGFGAPTLYTVSTFSNYGLVSVTVKLNRPYAWVRALKALSISPSLMTLITPNHEYPSMLLPS